MYHVKLKNIKTFALTLALIYIIANTYAQGSERKHQLSFEFGGVGYNNSILHTEKSSLGGKIAWYDKESFLVYPEFGVTLNRNITDSYTFSTGISYRYRRYNAEAHSLQNGDITSYYRYSELAVPAVASFRLSNKKAFGLYCSAGILFNLLLHIEGYRAGSTVYLDEHTFGDFNGHDKFGIDYYSDLKIKYAICNGREIFLAPFFTYHIIKKDYYKGMDLYALGLKLGITYKSF